MIATYFALMYHFYSANLCLYKYCLGIKPCFFLIWQLSIIIIRCILFICIIHCYESVLVAPQPCE